MGHFNGGYRLQGVGSMSEHDNEDDPNRWLTLSPPMGSSNGEEPTEGEMLMRGFEDPSQQHIEPTICK